MGYQLLTENKYNFFDMLSMMQKGIRRGLYDYAGFAAYEVRKKYRKAMWNRLLVISAEDCFGIITKEIINLRKKDEEDYNDSYIADAIALMCSALKSRDACYFACNFILCTRNPRDVVPKDEYCPNCLLKNDKNNVHYNKFGFAETSLFSSSDLVDDNELTDKENSVLYTGDILWEALLHRDMDMIGWAVNKLRSTSREFLWDVFVYFSKKNSNELITSEINALQLADDYLNGKKKEKDEIFISKAVMVLLYALDKKFNNIFSSKLIEYYKDDKFIPIDIYNVKPLSLCELKDNEIPNWVFDCHTLKGKKMGKTDWDMTTSEQAALYPLSKDYFSNASWLYIYEQDFKEGSLTEEGITPIRKFAETHKANPVDFIPY